VGWQETGTPGAICYQIATKKPSGSKGLSRGGLSRTFAKRQRASFHLRMARGRRLRVRTQLLPPLRTLSFRLSIGNKCTIVYMHSRIYA
jgi:hypothetical protein